MSRFLFPMGFLDMLPDTTAHHSLLLVHTWMGRTCECALFLKPCWGHLGVRSLVTATLMPRSAPAPWVQAERGLSSARPQQSCTSNPLTLCSHCPGREGRAAAPGSGFSSQSSGTERGHSSKPLSAVKASLQLSVAPRPGLAQHP